MQLIVLGMHRSGTSGVTRLLNLAGAWFGPDGIATEANAENPKGFWERRDVRAVCDGLLQGSGFDWWKISGFSPEAIPDHVRDTQLSAFAEILGELDAHQPWVLKEPRLCLLLPVLLPLLDSPVCIHVTREPLEVAQSVHARGHASVQGALALWEAYTIAAFQVSMGLPRLHVRHEDVMADPVGTTTRLIADLQAFGVEGLSTPSEREISSFITPGLHRQHRVRSDRGLRLNRVQERLADAIDAGAILDVTELPTLSEGSVDQLHLLEELHARQEQLAANALELAAAGGRLRQEQRRRQLLAKSSTDGLARIDRDVRAIGTSRAWKVGAYLTAVRRTITPGMSRTQSGPLGRALGQVERTRREVQGRISGADQDRTDAPMTGPQRGRAQITRSRPPSPRTNKPKVAVLAWDVGHNPIGRANVLAGVLSRHADVEIWGAQFERYGSRVWAPLRDGSITVNSFAGLSFPDHLAQMQAVAREIDADAVWVSKPRLPSYLLGAMAKELVNRPLILDVDDHELAFFGEDTGLDIDVLRSRRSNDADLALPFERTWTRACDPLIGSADLVTVSNPVLQERYGGSIVPHARDEMVFDPNRYDREQTRQRLGISPETRLLLFGGTPRVHKGVVEVLQALDEIGDDRYRVLMFGTHELEELRPLIGPLERWALALPYQPFDQLAPIVGAADLSCVLQDPDHPVARYQMPAKITDALAMAVPCLVSPVPPLADLIDQGAVQAVGPGSSLAEAISTSFDRPGEALDRASVGRKVFLESMSYQAVGESVFPHFEALIADPPPMAPGLASMIEVPRALYGPKAKHLRHTPPVRPIRVPGRSTRAIAPGSKFDVAMFWKQNDTGIYGRRQDMFVEYLRRSGRVGKIIHFDNPISPESIAQAFRGGSAKQSHQGRLVAHQTVGRIGRRRDTDQVRYRTFVFGGRKTRLLGLKARDSYVDFVLRTLAREGIGERPLVVWTYPSNPDLPDLMDAIDADIVVTDVVDDNRTWYPEGSPHHDLIDLNYEEVLARSDIVIANCAPVAESMARFAPVVHVVPNGLELPVDGPPSARPRELGGLNGPIIGYVGNLSSRIDIDLLESLSERQPGWQFVFVGSAHLDGTILGLADRPNVHFVGVKPYAEAKRFIEHFDVALIPHLDNEMTRAMNPLKAFVYCAAGVPVVATPVANLTEVADLITIAEGPAGFERAIEDALAAPRKPADRSQLEEHAWERRVEQVLDLIDHVGSSS